jgi:AmmeMemoRadiSam system protein B
MAAVHISPFSGAWYPSGAAELDRLLEELFETSRSRTGPYLFSDGIGYVVPHAGPQYSGAVAASPALHRQLGAEELRIGIILSGGNLDPDVLVRR